MIVIDNRESRSGVPEALAALDVPCELAHLDVGDYVVNDSLFVERKTIADFLQSIQDQRLFDQVSRLRADYRRSVLIVEGDHLPDRPRVRGILCSLAAQWSMPLLRSLDAKGTAWLLSHMHEHPNQLMAPYHQYDHRAKRHINSLEERMLLQLPKVGPDIAKRLLGAFGSIRNILNAGKEDLMSVEGVGTFIASQIVQLQQEE